MKSRLVVGFLFSSAVAPALAQVGPVVPHDITVASMFQQADWIVKTVMAILVLASVMTFSIWIAKAVEVIAGRRKIASSLRQLVEVPNLGAAATLPDPAAAAMVQFALKEVEHYPVGQRAIHADGIKERVAALIQRVEAGQLRKLSRGVSVLGSIGAAAPFIGLFGTVWGIMNSFIGIAQAQTTNLAVVAPGIAEALLATAFGLVAAIPAVLVYNAVTRAIAGYRLRLNDAATHIMCLLSRDLETDPAAVRAPKVGLVHGV